MNEQQFSWFPKDGNCPDVFDNIEEAIQDAQTKFDNKSDPFDDEDSPIISVGAVRRFDFKSATEDVVDSIEDTMYSLVDDFLIGCDAENECNIADEEKEEFKKQATEALLPLIEKYVFVNPTWICTPTGKYNLSTKNWI